MTNYTAVNRRYSVENYSPEWPLTFEAIRKTLEKVFKDTLLQIEHVGSTSVEGMRAKPIIDVLVTVESISNLKNEVFEMQKLGYLYAKDYVAENSIFFCKNEGDIRLENIHVFPAEHPHAVEILDTRDYLRAHPEEVVRYETLKVSLAKTYPYDYVLYRKEKDVYLNLELAEKVRKWKLKLC